MKTKLFFLVVLIHQLSWAQIPTAGLDSQYKFTSGALNDSFGSNNLTQNGTALNAISDRFSGSTDAVNLSGDYLQRTALQGLTSMSVSFWIKTSTNTTSIKTIIDQTERNSAANTTAQKGWYVYLQNGRVGLYSNYGYNYQHSNGTSMTGNVGYYNLTTTLNVADDNWHHVVVLIKGRTYFWQSTSWLYENEYTIYVDNVQRNTYLHNYHTYDSGGWYNAPNTFPNVPVTIGNNRLGNLTTGNAYSDVIDDIRIYKGTILTAANVNSLYLENPLTRFYVNSAATGDNNGSSWANAYTNLQSALSAANSQDIWVASGTYKPHATDRNASFTIPVSINLFGGFNGTESQVSQRNWRTNPTILSGDLLGNDDATISFTNVLRNDNSYHIVKANANNITLDGFIFSNAHANGAASADKSGAAILKAAPVSSLTIKNSVFRNNVSLNGGAGIFAEYNATGTAALNIENSEFKNNLATYGTTVYSFTNNTTTLNIAISNSLFDGNSAIDDGATKGYAGSAGWFRAYANGSVLITNFTNNTYVNNADTGTHATVLNRATIGVEKRGTAVINSQISNCIFWNNLDTGGTPAKAINRIADTFSAATTAANNSLDADNFSTITTKQNIAITNPQFVSASNFQLSSGSPAIDSGDNTKVPATILADLLGNQRIYNTTVDMGVYEYESILGIQSFHPFQDFTMYPNPVTSILTIQTEEVIKQIGIYTLEGKSVKETTENKIDVSNLQSGFYLVKVITGENKIGVKKFIKR